MGATRWQAAPTKELLLFDIDGTLTDRRRRLDLELIAVLRDLEEAGYMVGLASGNVLPTVVSLARFIGCSGPSIAENGGVIQVDGRITVLAEPPELETAQQRVIEQLGLVPLSNNRCRYTELAFEERVDGRSVDLAKVQAVVADLSLQVEATGFALHLMPIGVDKGRAILAALDQLGLPRSILSAVGDGLNDLPMLRLAHRSGAPSDAPETVRDAVTTVARAPHARGTHEILTRWGLCPGPPTQRH